MRLIFHLAAAVVIGYLAVFYANPVMTALFLLWIVIPFISAALTFYTVRRLKVTLRPRKPVVELGDPLRFVLLLENTGIVPASRCVFRLRCGGGYNENDQKIRLTASVGARKKQELEAVLKCDCVGLTECEILKGSVSDLLNLFRFRIAARTRTSVAVLPPVYPAAVFTGEWESVGPELGEDCDPDKGGENPSEVFQIRPYREGDRLRSIHWKLSARADDLIVREFAHTVQSMGALIVDVSMPANENEKSRIWLNNLFSLTLSVAFGMLRADLRFYLAWYDWQRSELQRHLIEKDEDLYEALAQVYHVPLGRQSQNLFELYERLYPSGVRIGVNAGLELFRNEQLEYAFHSDQLEEELRNQAIWI